MTALGIQVRFVGQLGNQLFLYVLGKMLAERTGLAYEPPRHFLNKYGNPVQWSAQPFFIPKPTEGLRLSSPPIVISGVHWADFNIGKSYRPIIVGSGYYQRYEIYRDFKDKIINDWLKIPPDRFKQTDPDAVYIHVRRTDFVDIGNGTAPDQRYQCAATTIDEYAECLKRFPDAKAIVLITDNPNDPFITQFSRFGLPCKFSRAQWDDDFLTLASCRQMITSQSTFSWWAGFLGRAEKIVCPVYKGSYWGNGDGAIGEDRSNFPNLFVDDEPRWEWVRNG